MSVGSCDRLAEPDRNAPRVGRGPFPEKLAAAKAEDAAPQFVEIDRNDRRAGAALDFQHAGLERLQLAGAADAAFRKDAHELAGLQRFAGRFDRSPRGFGRRLDRDRAHDLRQAVGPPVGR